MYRWFSARKGNEADMGSVRFTFATLLSVYNKWMFSPDRFAFPYPLFVTALHMIMQFLLAASLRWIWPKRFKPEHNPSLKDWGSVLRILLLTKLISSVRSM